MVPREVTAADRGLPSGADEAIPVHGDVEARIVPLLGVEIATLADGSPLAPLHVIGGDAAAHAAARRPTR